MTFEEAKMAFVKAANDFCDTIKENDLTEDQLTEAVQTEQDVSDKITEVLADKGVEIGDERVD